MAGASGSGEEMQTGRTNRAEGRTILWAQVPPGQSNFNGPAIMIVEVAKDAEDPNDYENGDTFVPSNQFDGLVATGWSGGSASNFGGTPGGTGVTGRGGRNEGTGVLGLGGGTPEPENGGAGGIGVRGLGGPQADFFANPAVAPGAGIVGQGGRQSDRSNTGRLPHAAGVIGISGGAGQKIDLLPAHPLTDTGGVGVYGQGAEVTISMVPPQDASGTIPGANVPSGPAAPGVGVLGRGGISAEPRIPNGPGVVGLAGGVPVSAITGDSTTGVIGQGPEGVRGQGTGGIGVHGVSDTHRGGVFSSDAAAQVQLVPHRNRGPFPAATNVTPTAISADRNERGRIELPKAGEAGDLCTVMDDRHRATLWFCVQGANGGPAKWAQVLLGPDVDGTA